VKLNPEKNQMKLKKEILAVQKILESKHAHKDAMIKELKTKAPSLSSAVQTAFSKAQLEAHKHMKAFTPDTHKGVQKVIFDVCGKFAGESKGGSSAELMVRKSCKGGVKVDFLDKKWKFLSLK
jgi:Tfp pilus assembly protein PilE